MSDRPAKNENGWLHALDSKPANLPPPEPPKPTINATKILSEWTPTRKPLSILAQSLSVNCDALESLRAVWAPPHFAWAFPMRDGHGDTCGIRLRADSGRKWAVPGSRQGIFLPYSIPQSTCYVCEGPTDTAAALTLNLFAIGRPSCLGCEGQIQTAFRRLNIHQAVILSDNDSPGLRGAEQLAKSLHIPCCILAPPCKDLREFVSLGGSGKMLESMASNLAWHMPQK